MRTIWVSKKNMEAMSSPKEYPVQTPEGMRSLIITLSSTTLPIDWKIHHPSVDSNPTKLLGVDHSPGNSTTEDICKPKKGGLRTINVMVVVMFSTHMYSWDQNQLQTPWA